MDLTIKFESQPLPKNVNEPVGRGFKVRGWYRPQAWIYLVAFVPPSLMDR